jgi:alpha-beta hydrolase superfamily lysophospholipase
LNREQSFLTGAGGLRIFWQAWLPATGARAVVVIAHGASEHSDRYEHVAARLVGEGYAVYAIEHRGHGRSEGRRALIDRIDNAVADLDALVLRAAADRPGVPLFLLGHSMGATVSLRYALAHQDRLSGLILSGALAALEPPPLPQQLVIRALSAVAPGLRVVPIDANLVSRDPAVVKAYVEDPRVYHGKLPARTVAELADAIASFPDHVATITIPTLVMYGTADRLCPTAGSRMLEHRLGSSDVTVRAYEGLHHEIFNEPERERVLDDLCTWLAARVSITTTAS